MKSWGLCIPSHFHFASGTLRILGVVYGLPGDACLDRCRLSGDTCLKRSSGHPVSLYPGLFTNSWLHLGSPTWASELQPRMRSSVASIWWVFNHMTCLEDGFGRQSSCGSLVPLGYCFLSLEPTRLGHVYQLSLPSCFSNGKAQLSRSACRGEMVTSGNTMRNAVSTRGEFALAPVISKIQRGNRLPQHTF